MPVGRPGRGRNSNRKQGSLAITDKKHRVNEDIRVPRVRLIDADGEQVGIVETEEARTRAEEEGWDLVEVAPNADPPVCRMMDYGKYIYRLNKEQKQKQHQTQLKEVKFRPKIDDHDFNFKLNHIERFLKQGDMVKATIWFRGREVVHPELGRDILDRILDEVGEMARIEQEPKMEGRQMTMLLTPKRD